MNIVVYSVHHVVISEFCGESLEPSSGYRDRNERQVWTLVWWGQCVQMKGPVTLGGLGPGAGWGWGKGSGCLCRAGGSLGGCGGGGPLPDAG